jgi:hypothetical protein
MELFSEPFFVFFGVITVPALVKGFADWLTGELHSVERVTPDWLAIVATTCALYALGLWVLPQYAIYRFPFELDFGSFFELTRLPFIVAFVALAYFLLLLRRR